MLKTPTTNFNIVENFNMQKASPSVFTPLYGVNHPPHARTDDVGRFWLGIVVIEPRPASNNIISLLGVLKGRANASAGLFILVFPCIVPFQREVFRWDSPLIVCIALFLGLLICPMYIYGPFIDRRGECAHTRTIPQWRLSSSPRVSFVSRCFPLSFEGAPTVL